LTIGMLGYELDTHVTSRHDTVVRVMTWRDGSSGISDLPSYIFDVSPPY